MIREIERIFYSQFKETESYLKIITLLEKGMHALGEIAVALKKKSGGSIKYLLEQLENAEMIDSRTSVDKKDNTNVRRYRLSDEFLIFFRNEVFIIHYN